jgi:hypothetical protein
MRRMTKVAISLRRDVCPFFGVASQVPVSMFTCSGSVDYQTILQCKTIMDCEQYWFPLDGRRMELFS